MQLLHDVIYLSTVYTTLNIYITYTNFLLTESTGKYQTEVLKVQNEAVGRDSYRKRPRWLIFSVISIEVLLKVILSYI